MAFKADVIPKNQLKSLIEPIYIEFQNQLDSIGSSVELIYDASLANDATQNSTRGVLFGPIQGPIL